MLDYFIQHIDICPLFLMQKMVPFQAILFLGAKKGDYRNYYSLEKCPLNRHIYKDFWVGVCLATKKYIKKLLNFIHFRVSEFNPAPHYLLDILPTLNTTQLKHFVLGFLSRYDCSGFCFILSLVWGKLMFLSKPHKPGRVSPPFPTLRGAVQNKLHSQLTCPLRPFAHTPQASIFYILYGSPREHVKNDFFV